jgi:hypothetical protein
MMETAKIVWTPPQGPSKAIAFLTAAMNEAGFECQTKVVWDYEVGGPINGVYENVIDDHGGHPTTGCGWCAALVKAMALLDAEMEIIP